MIKTILALGGNMGNVQLMFLQAERQIQDLTGKIILSSSVYKTEPWGNKKQNDFLNKIIVVETFLTASEVLKNNLHIEEKLGRQRKKDDQYAPRVIDIDILFYNNKIINTEELIIPHPRLHLRNFVLAPLSEVIPDFVHPLLKQTISNLYKKNTDNSRVEKL